ncbi:hypothetical protein Glove_501g15 [Diversispora epigaea]|uniref:Chitin-binding type-2 domain-containing protein n=1 Tax=Diversispora epigaea TaxID=1348612 RepID=A0A397GLG4_9GLOM|nr:hypothetical protein Glove_501g15 [Diversispora epigaea]
MKSAEGGYSNGQSNLRRYENGIGKAKDEEKAFQWYMKSGEGGNGNGQNNLERVYENGIGTTKDEKKAFQWYMKSAEGGYSNGQSNLRRYENGIGTTKDEEKAFQWYLKSAKEGNIIGQYNLGHCYRTEGRYRGAQTLLGDYYRFGFKTTKSEIKKIKDDKKIFHRYLKSVEEGNIDGQNKLGYCYLLGIGIIKDDEKAFQCYLKLAEGGNSAGQYSFANCYFYGIGITKDEKKALRWYIKSSKGGNKTHIDLTPEYLKWQAKITIIPGISIDEIRPNLYKRYKNETGLDPWIGDDQLLTKSLIDLNYRSVVEINELREENAKLKHDKEEVKAESIKLKRELVHQFMLPAGVKMLKIREQKTTYTTARDMLTEYPQHTAEFKKKKTIRFKIKCLPTDEYLRDPEDCSKFFRCSDGGTPLSFKCPDGLQFNSAINVCDYPQNVDCSISSEE